MNVLTYDYYTAFDKQTNHHAPLTIRPGQQVDESNKRLNIDWTINYYLSLGAAPSKLIVGVPTYGRSYTLSSSLGLDQAQLSGDEEATDIADKIGLGARADGPGEEGSATREKGYLAYYEICQRIDNEQWVKQKFASDHQGPLAYRANQWVSYDDVESVIMKTQYVIKKRLGGVMVWTLDNDDFRGSCPSSQHNENPLITAIRDTIIKSVQTVAPKWQATTTTTSTTTTTTTTSTTTTTPMPAIDSTDDGNELSVSGSSESASASDVGTSLIRSLATQASNRPAPTTPDPGPAFTCKDEGFFPNPKDCRKYFWCLDSGPANLGVVAHAFTCPSGLFFNSQTEGCDYPEKVSCRIKSSTTTKAPSRTERPTTTMSSTSSTSTTGKPALSGLSAERNRMVVKKNRKPSSTSTTTTTTTTTTSTTTPAPPTTTLAAIAATNDINELVASMLQNPQFASVINNQLKLSQQQQQAQRQAAASQADEAGASDQSGAAGEPSPVSEEFGSSLAGAANSKQAKDLLQLLNLIQSLGGVDKIAPYLANQTLAASGSGASLAEPLAELDEQMGSPAAPSRQRRPQVQLDVGGGGGTEPASNNREPFVFSYGQPSVAGGQRLSTQNGIMANDNDQENGQPVGSNGVAAQLTPEIMNNLAQLESLFAYNQPGRTAAGQQTVGASEASTSRQPLVESQPFTLDDARFTPIQTGRQVQQAAGLGDPLIRVQVPGAHQHRQQQVQQQQQQAEQLARQSAARDRQPAPRQQQQFNDIAGFLPYLEGDVRQPVATRAHQHFSDQSGGLLVDHSPTGARKATTGNRLAAQAADQRRPVAAMTQQPRLGAGQVQPRAQAQVQAQQPQQQRRRPPNRERGQRANAIDFPPAGEQSSALEEQQRPRSLVLLTAGPPTFNRALEANADATSSSSADSLTDRTLEDRLRMLENGYYSTTSLPEPADSSDAPPSSSTAISSIRRDLPTGRLRTDQEPDSAAPDTSQPTSPADDEPIAPSARTDQSGPGALVDQQTGSLVCTRRGVFAHPNSCGQFIVCAPQSRSQRSLRPFEHHCPAEHIFHVSIAQRERSKRARATPNLNLLRQAGLVGTLQAQEFTV